MKTESQTAPDLSKVTRLEVIDQNGRSYVNMGAKKVELSIQDEGRTLKVFTNWGDINVQA